MSFGDNTGDSIRRAMQQNFSNAEFTHAHTRLDDHRANQQGLCMAEHTTSEIAVRGCRIRLMRGGSGEPLLYLHGASGASWLPVLQKLSEKFDVIAPEHPGFGDSDSPDWLDTIHD